MCGDRTNMGNEHEEINKKGKKKKNPPKKSNGTFKRRLFPILAKDGSSPNITYGPL